MRKETKFLSLVLACSMSFSMINALAATNNGSEMGDSDFGAVELYADSTAAPAVEETANPTAAPAAEETANPTSAPAAEETANPTSAPTTEEIVLSEIEMTADYADKITVTRTVEDNAVVFELTAIGDNEIPDVNLFSASYDGNALVSVTLGNKEKEDDKLVITAELPKNSAHKYMLWDSEQKPVIKAVTNITDMPDITAEPTATATVEPTATATAEPTATATVEPTATATVEPTEEPTADELLYAEICSIAEEVDVGEVDEEYTDNINVYMNWGTVSPLYSLLNVYLDIDEANKNHTQPTKSFMWYERPTTADEKLLPENVTLMNDIDIKYNSGANNAENTKKCMGFIKKVYETYPNAHYTLFTDDLRAQYEFLMMNYTGIPKAQYNVILGTDGTATYSYIKNYLYKNSNPNNVEEVMGEVNDKWGWYAYWYHEYQKRISNHIVDQPRFLNTNGGASFVMWEQASQDNVEYWVQWPELLVSDVEGLNEYLTTKMHVVKKHHNDMFAQLSDESKHDFLNLVLGGAFKDANYPEDTDFKALYDQTYMPGYNDNSKKYIIISGTSKSGEGSSAAFEARVNAVIDYFGDNYTYLYKPHPRWPASTIEGRAAYLESKGIVELPAQTPMEVLLWTYPKVYVGGYNSSLYMSATTPGQVKFFLAAGPNSLSAPLPDLYNLGYFNDAIFFNPDPIIKEPAATASPAPAATASPEPAATASPEPAATASPEPAATASPVPAA